MLEPKLEPTLEQFVALAESEPGVSRLVVEFVQQHRPISYCC